MQLLAGLNKPLHLLPGIGPRTAAGLTAAGLSTQRDLLLHLPRTWQDRRKFSSIALSDGSTPLAVRLRVREQRRIRTHSGKPLLKLIVDDGETVAELVCFNRDFLARSLPVGCEIDLFGVFTYRQNRWQCTSFEFQPAGGEGEYREFGMLLPVYPLFQGVGQKTLRKAICALLAGMQPLQDVIPDYLRERRQLLPLDEALRLIHIPGDGSRLRQARESLAYSEFFLFEAGQRHAKAVRAASGKPRRYTEGELLSELEAQFGFNLTAEQRRVCGEIDRDLFAPVPMQRLLMGDVGCGKTAVAAAAVLRVVRSGYQCAVAAPTGVLAGQLFRKLYGYLQPLGVSCAILTGKTVAAERKDVCTALQRGDLQLLVGTHALFSDDVAYHQLGLVVIDEQHRFGVNHRRALTAKGRAVDYLAMSATPIPRSLSMTLYGGFDMSIIRESPAGRQPVETRWEQHRGGEAYRDLLARLERGEQGYVVYPLVEESEKSDLAAAEQGYQKLLDSPAGRYGVGLLHGRMTEAEKERVMSEFLAGEIGVLAATSVVEVGVDNPQATVMVVREAQRFGLSQLHQLRGRVGRGSAASCCWLITGKCSGECVRRMETMLQFRDGFRIAEEDLAMRGPGDFFGVSQTGLPQFRTADPVEQIELLEVARADAYFILDRDPALLNPHNTVLHRALQLEQQEGGAL